MARELIIGEIIMSNSNTKYRVDYRLNMGKKEYEVGDPISLSDEEAEPLLNTNPPVLSLASQSEKAPASDKTNVVKLQKAPEDEADRIVAIKEAISLLDKDDQTHWTKNEEPDANVLTELLGWKVKASERNQAWMEVLEAEGQG